MSKGLEVINSMLCLGSQKQFSVAEAQNLREEEVEFHSLLLSIECLLYAGPFSGTGFGHSEQSGQNLCPRGTYILVGRREKHKLVSKQANNTQEVISAEEEYKVR